MLDFDALPFEPVDFEDRIRCVELAKALGLPTPLIVRKAVAALGQNILDEGHLPRMKVVDCPHGMTYLLNRAQAAMVAGLVIHSLRGADASDEVIALIQIGARYAGDGYGAA